MQYVVVLSSITLAPSPFLLYCNHLAIKCQSHQRHKTKTFALCNFLDEIRIDTCNDRIKHKPSLGRNKANNIKVKPTQPRHILGRQQKSYEEHEADTSLRGTWSTKIGCSVCTDCYHRILVNVRSPYVGASRTRVRSLHEYWTFFLSMQASQSRH
jgi:hypothetical protein